MLSDSDTLSPPFPGSWPRSVLLALLTPNAAAADREAEELEENPRLGCCLRAEQPAARATGGRS